MLLSAILENLQMVELVRADGEGLAASVKGTSDLSERVSAKVRELDSAQSHVRQTLSRISVIVDRTNCIYGMNDSLEKQDYESATGFVNKFLELEERCGPGAVEDSKQAEQQQQVMRMHLPSHSQSCIRIQHVVPRSNDWPADSVQGESEPGGGGAREAIQSDTEPPAQRNRALHHALQASADRGSRSSSHAPRTLSDVARLDLLIHSNP